MSKNNNNIKMQKYAITIALLIILCHYALGQGLIISSDTHLIGSGGNIVLPGNVVNDGSFINDVNTVIFAGAAQSLAGTSPVLFNNLTVASGSTATITTAGQTLKAILVSNGTLNTGGNITLLSTASQTALIDGSGTGQVNGNVNMQRYIPSGFGYKYFSSPFQAATVNEFADDITLGSFTFYRYEESRTLSGWVSYNTPSTNLLIPLEGYAVNFGAIAAPNTTDITGVVNNGSLSVTLYNNNNTYTKGFNLLGNPYPSPIDWYASSGWIKTNIDDALYYFKASTTDQYGGNYSTFIEGISSDGLASNIIPSMQGFFVHLSDGSYPVTGTLALNNSVRVNDMTHSFVKSGSSIELKPCLRLVAGYSDNPVSYDPLIIYFDDKATVNFDGQYDALKLFNTDMAVTNFYSFANDGRKLSIDGLPLNNDSFWNIRLGLKTERGGDVIFRIRDIIGVFQYDIISITDVITGTAQDLLDDKVYKVYLPAGDYQDRFFLNLSNLATAIPEIVPVTDWLNIYSYHGTVKVEINLPEYKNGVLTICNLIGQVLFKQNIYTSGHYEIDPMLKDGLYIISLIYQNNRFSKKIILQN
jgi:hypothetical protein